MVNQTTNVMLIKLHYIKMCPIRQNRSENSKKSSFRRINIDPQCPPQRSQTQQCGLFRLIPTQNFVRYKHRAGISRSVLFTGTQIHLQMLDLCLLCLLLCVASRNMAKSLGLVEIKTTTPFTACKFFCLSTILRRSVLRTKPTSSPSFLLFRTRLFYISEISIYSFALRRNIACNS